VVRAWDNRCPHRGMRLSFGFVRGESLTCIYHGWQYGTDGVCHTIPAHPDLTPPATLCATAFGCIEKDGIIWASVSDHDGQPDVEFGDAHPIRSLSFDRNVETIGAMLGTALFPISEASRPDECNFETVIETGGLIVRVGKDVTDERQLIAALQPLPGDRTAAHVLTSPSASPGLKKILSRWLDRLRWFTEHPYTETGPCIPEVSAMGG
jgi:nitrite reductase/ring-hydroxylating ferredoxin subunit